MANANRRMSEQFGLRLPEGMRDKIARAAEANNRSMNAEIVACLEMHYATGSSESAVAFNPTGSRTPVTLSEKVQDHAQAILHILNSVAELQERVSLLEGAAQTSQPSH